MASEKKLSDISSSLTKTLNRIETLQKQSKVPWTAKFRQHLSKNNQQLHSIILAGCVLAVAAGRLQQKSEFEVPSLQCPQKIDCPAWLHRATVLHAQILEGRNTTMIRLQDSPMHSHPG